MNYLFIFFFFISISFSQNKPNIQAEINESNLTLWYDFVYSDAASNVRLRFALDVLGKYAAKSEYPKSVKVGLSYVDAFKDDKDQYDLLLNVIRNYSKLMLSINPKPEDFDIYKKFVEDNISNYQSITAIKKIASYYVNQRKWDSAISIWKEYEELVPKFNDEVKKIIDLLSQNDKRLSINPLGININTSADEWDPNVSADGKYLYYSASHRAGGKGNSDIWVAEFDGKNWVNPKNFEANINTIKNETIDNISLDGNKLLLSGDFMGTYGKFDIYMLEQDENGWGQIRHLPRPINSQYTDEAANLSADGQVLLFTSDRPGAIGDFREFNSQVFNGSIMGNMDIYVSEKKDGTWQEPINLGESINTPFAERSPYLHPDGKTLYFSSDGHYGLGGLDVYKTTRLSDTSWTEWSEPVNLGKEINSILDDWGYKISLNGDSAYFAAYNRTIGQGGWDLYSISLPNAVKPEELITIRGKVINSDGKPLFANVIWEDVKNKKYLGEITTNPKSGEFLIALPKGKFYGYYANKNSYYPSSAFLDLTKEISKKEIEITMTLFDSTALLSGKNIRINNLFFDHDSFTIKEESFSELNRLVKYLKSNKYKIQIIGHTDSTGTKEYNLKLSENRAKAIVDYLVKNGIKKSRLSAIGKGDSEPVEREKTVESNALNRRVEIKINK